MLGIARPWRIEYEGAYCHVLSRGNEGREIFYGDEDKRLFLKSVGEMSDRFEIILISWYLSFGKHFHELFFDQSNPQHAAIKFGHLTLVRFHSLWTCSLFRWILCSQLLAHPNLLWTRLFSGKLRYND